MIKCESSNESQEGMHTRMMKKARSVDFGRILSRSCNSQTQDATLVASEFSRKAARGAFSVSLSSSKRIDSSMSSHDDLHTQIKADLCRSSEITGTNGSPSRSPASSLTLGRKISLSILCLATIGQFASQLQVQIPGLKLASEDIHPPVTHQGKNARIRPRIGLGSAAITSVTEALSPILPFAGGVDLRREEYTSGNWFENIKSVTSELKIAYFSRKGEQQEGTESELHRDGTSERMNLSLSQPAGKQRKWAFISSLSSQKPFVSVESIADMTLDDVAETFRYALESSKQGFNERRFFRNVSTRVKKVVDAMNRAVAKSRGGVKQTIVPVAPQMPGNYDALKFSAAMRLLAEWRILRQVPDGYKGYAVGMNLGHKDVVQNVAKIEQVVHSWIELNCLQDARDDECQSPTLNQLLRHEINLNVHPQLPRLKDPTAAMGALWVRRQLQYQTLLLANLLKLPHQYASTVDAVSAAYKGVYDRYHGWAVQKIFDYSFQSAPEAPVIYRQMNPHRLEEVKRVAEQMEFSSPSTTKGQEGLPHASQNIFDRIGFEWNKRFGKASPEAVVAARGGGSRPVTDDLDDFISREMAREAHGQIERYLEIVSPLVDDLARLFKTHNMDDPTKV